jgi:hypothetical protein
MFRALTCPSSGGKILSTQHLVSSLSVNVYTVHRLRADCSPLSTSALNLVNEIILYYDARSKKHQIPYVQSQKYKKVKTQTVTPSHAEDIISYELGMKQEKILIATLF